MRNMSITQKAMRMRKFAKFSRFFLDVVCFFFVTVGLIKLRCIFPVGTYTHTHTPRRTQRSNENDMFHLIAANNQVKWFNCVVRRPKLETTRLPQTYRDWNYSYVCLCNDLWRAPFTVRPPFYVWHTFYAKFMRGKTIEANWRNVLVKIAIGYQGMQAVRVLLHFAAPHQCKTVLGLDYEESFFKDNKNFEFFHNCLIPTPPLHMSLALCTLVATNNALCIAQKFHSRT